MNNSLTLLLAGFSLAFVGTSARADCLDDAARYHKVNASLVRAIAQQESGMHAFAVNKNTDGTEDIGLMQINSSWLPKLARYGISRERLFDACVNSYVGTWILAANMKQFGPTWKAVGAYNAASANKQLAYANLIYRRLMRSAN
jgi:soluble lytic murein transglycosylase-like protein